MDTSIRPFKIHVEDAVLDDLKRRLQNTRTMPEGFNEGGKHYGKDRGLQKELLEYWRDEYDWRKHERELNSFSNFKTNIRGLNVHFIHEKSPHAQAVPLILVHGWPGSVWEFHKVIPTLVQDASSPFHVIVPSIPGYGWSEAAKEPGMSIAKVAQMFNELMVRLGYQHYVAQGGDWGALITKQMALQFPLNCVALHQNMPTPPFRNVKVTLQSLLDISPLGKLYLSADDQERLSNCLEYTKSGMAYLLLHSSKPHTLGDALEDSPAGLLSWIVEKCFLWTDSRKGLLNVLSKDELLTNVTIYWVTNTITSSMRLYFESLPLGKRSPDAIPFLPDGYVHVPTAVAFYPKEAISFPIRWLQYGYNIIQVSQFAEGGHFAAWEQPQSFIKDIQKFAHETLPFDKARALVPHRQKLLESGGSASKIIPLVAAGALAGLIFSRL